MFWNALATDFAQLLRLRAVFRGSSGQMRAYVDHDDYVVEIYGKEAGRVCTKTGHRSITKPVSDSRHVWRQFNVMLENLLPRPQPVLKKYPPAFQKRLDAETKRNRSYAKKKKPVVQFYGFPETAFGVTTHKKGTHTYA